MKKTLIAGLVTLGLMVGLCGTAGANLILNGSFEEGTYTDDGSGFQTLFESPVSPIANWNVAGGSIDWIGSYWVASDDSMSIDLAGLYQHGLILGTAFDTEIGKTYRVQFDMAGNPDRDYAKSLVAVAISGSGGAYYEFIFNQTGHTHTDMGWETMSFDFIAGSLKTELSFGDVTNSINGEGEAWGAALDNVRVELAPVPEPSTLLLLGAGFAGLGIFGRRLRRSSKK